MGALLRWGLFVALTAYAVTCNAATRTFTVNWSHDCHTVNGDSLDVDGDGFCEGLGGWRVYTADGVLLEEIPEDGSRLYAWRSNVSWGEACFYMTAWMPDPLNPGGILESVPSNVGACLLVEPGKPNQAIVAE